VNVLASNEPGATGEQDANVDDEGPEALYAIRLVGQPTALKTTTSAGAIGSMATNAGADGSDRCTTTRDPTG
jgi:hypothetical protein